MTSTADCKRNLSYVVASLSTRPPTSCDDPPAAAMSAADKEITMAPSQQQDQTPQQQPQQEQTQAPQGAPPQARYRQLMDHRVDDAERVRVDALNHEPGRYRLSGFDSGPTVEVQFQQGDPAEVGVNGTTPAQMLAVVADQLRQANETAAAKHVQQAIEQLTKAARDASAKRRQDAATAPAAAGDAGTDVAAARTAAAAAAGRAAAGR
jgi:hypothetical protein